MVSQSLDRSSRRHSEKWVPFEKHGAFSVGKFPVKEGVHDSDNSAMNENSLNEYMR